MARLPGQRVPEIYLMQPPHHRDNYTPPHPCALHEFWELNPRSQPCTYTELFSTNYLCISQLFLSPYRISSTTLSTRGSSKGLTEDSRHRTQLNSLLRPSCSQSRQLFQNENSSFLFTFGFEEKFRLRTGHPSVEKAPLKLAFLSPHRALLQYQLQTHID